jgi:hypothetical protein
LLQQSGQRRVAVHGGFNHPVEQLIDLFPCLTVKLIGKKAGLLISFLTLAQQSRMGTENDQAVTRNRQLAVKIQVDRFPAKIVYLKSVIFQDICGLRDEVRVRLRRVQLVDEGGFRFHIGPDFRRGAAAECRHPRQEHGEKRQARIILRTMVRLTHFAAA